MSNFTFLSNIVREISGQVLYAFKYMSEKRKISDMFL
jgi:hypothetical protein